VDASRARLALTGLTQGLHNVVARLTDAQSNVATAEYSFTVELDVAPPTITVNTPTGFVAELRPLISASFTDNASGVDDGSVELEIDGRSVTANVEESIVTYTPGSDLDVGKHSVTLSVSDALGNEAKAEWEFTIETTPPSVSTVVPTPGQKIRGNADIRAEITVSAFYTDAQSGVDESTVTLAVTGGGVAVAGTITSQSASAISWKPTAALEAGVYTASLSVSDNVGNKTDYEWTFIVEDEVALTRPPLIVPNPFADEVGVWIGLGREAEVSVRIFDFNQRLVASRPGELFLPGVQKVSLSDELVGFARGVYFCQLIIETGDGERVVKVLKMAKVR
ncbi:MAG: Ig-like domain-containing protein, partial [Candidatus Poribacteria bacterium]|nr:Ig-like domain-containing protein [Candidatus Poribacteria bacterium]